MSIEIYANQVSQSKLDELLSHRCEAEDLDFKEKYDGTSKKDQIELCKDIIAMANTRGGHIVLGVRDSDFAPVGLPMDTRIDEADIRNTLDNYVGEQIEFLIARYHLEINGEKRLFAILYIVPSAVPVVTAKAGAYEESGRQKVSFQQATWLVRSGTRSKPATPAEVRALIEARQSPSAPLAPTRQLLPADYEPPVFHNLPRPNFINFIGREIEIAEIMAGLSHPRAWIIAIEGIGGVGKTALAQKVALDTASQAFRTGQTPWKFIVWMSAKETVLGTSGDIENVRSGFKTLEDLIDIVLDVTGFELDESSSFDQRLLEAKQVLATFPCLLIVDNLETVEDDAVLDFLMDQLPSPSKAIITSRKRTEHKGGLVIRLEGMGMEQGTTLLREAAAFQGSKVIQTAPQAKLETIVNLTGGIPLALKLVVGQTALGADLDVVIDRLANSQDAPILDFCFRETYGDLEVDTQKLLGAASLFDESATLDEIAMVSQLPYRQAAQHAELLVRLSLLSESFDDARGKQVYWLLPLTRIFAAKQLRQFPEFREAARQRLALYYLEKEQYLRGGAVSEKSIRKAGARTDLERIAVALSDRAESLYQNRKYSDAIDLLQKAEILAPRFAYVQQVWAYIERRENHISAAREHYRKATEFDRDNAEYYRYWASLEAKVGQYGEAAKLFREASLLDPSDLRSRHGLAHALLNYAKGLKRISGKSEEVRAVLLEALEQVEWAFHPKATDDHKLLCWRTKASILRELRRPRQALDACEEGLKIGNDPRLESLAAELENELRR